MIVTEETNYYVYYIETGASLYFPEPSMSMTDMDNNITDNTSGFNDGTGGRADMAIDYSMHQETIIILKHLHSSGISLNI